MDIPDLSKLGKSAEQPQDSDATVVEADTAFLVVLREGKAVAVPDLNITVVRNRLPDHNDFYLAAQQIAKDVAVQETVQMTVGTLQQMMMHQMEQVAAQQLANSLKI